MRSMQVRATQLEDATSAQLEVMRARARELRLRASDQQAREQQLREIRFQAPPGPEREKLDKQWMDARHNATATSIELEGLSERILEVRLQRDQARALTLRPPPMPAPGPVEAHVLENAGIGMLILFMAPLVVVLVYRLFTRGGAREPISLEAGARFQRMEQAIESIAMDVERIAEGQHFTTRILAERYPDSARAQATPLQKPGTITPR